MRRSTEDISEVRIARTFLRRTDERNRDARKLVALMERRRADARHATRNRDARKRGAIFERRIANESRIGMDGTGCDRRRGSLYQCEIRIILVTEILCVIIRVIR